MCFALARGLSKKVKMLLFIELILVNSILKLKGDNWCTLIADSRSIKVREVKTQAIFEEVVLGLPSGICTIELFTINGIQFNLQLLSDAFIIVDAENSAHLLHEGRIRDHSCLRVDISIGIVSYPANI